MKLRVRPNHVIFAGLVTGVFLILAWRTSWPYLRPPPITEQNITDKDWFYSEDASRKFTSVLERRFRTGSSEQVLIKVLRNQGFHSRDQGKYLDRELIFEWWTGFPCREDVSVIWSADKSGKITYIKGGYGNACP